MLLKTSKPFLYLNRVYRALLEKCNFVLTKFCKQIPRLAHILNTKFLAMELYYTLELVNILEWLD